MIWTGKRYLLIFWPPFYVPWWQRSVTYYSSDSETKDSRPFVYFIRDPVISSKDLKPCRTPSGCVSCFQSDSTSLWLQITPNSPTLKSSFQTFWPLDYLSFSRSSGLADLWFDTETSHFEVFGPVWTRVGGTESPPMRNTIKSALDRASPTIPVSDVIL